MLRMKLVGTCSSARIVGPDWPPVKAGNDCIAPLHFEVDGRQSDRQSKFFVARRRPVSVSHTDRGGSEIASRGLLIDESPDVGSFACLPSGELGRFEVCYWQSLHRPQE